jgi:hypothetical protein
MLKAKVNFSKVMSKNLYAKQGGFRYFKCGFCSLNMRFFKLSPYFIKEKPGKKTN